MVRQKTFVDPPGRGPSAVIVPATPSAASFRVPSPASTATTSTPSRAAARASRAAWPRRDVSATSSLWSAPRMRWISTRRRAVTDDAVRLTISSTRTDGQASCVPPGDSLPALTQEVTRCRACPRLVEWRERVGREKRAAFREAEYWARPVPGFGDPAARVVIVGLAPAAHGGNRTGRIFTGDRSGDWLFGALHRAGYANQPTSVSRDDGLRLRDAYVAAAVRCAPPANRPTPDERDRCLPFLVRELGLLDRVRVAVALGNFAYDALWRTLGLASVPLPVPRPRFGHGVEVPTKRLTVVCCYHPSQQNTFTGKLTGPMLDDVFRRARELSHRRAGSSPWSRRSRQSR
jgi:uracil-DNA glycosylase